VSLQPTRLDHLQYDENKLTHVVFGWLGLLINSCCASNTQAPSAKNISVQADLLSQTGCTPSAPSETTWWRISRHVVSMPRVILHFTLQSRLHQFFSLCQSPILKEHSGIGANRNLMFDWDYWVHACIRISMRWVEL